MKKILNKIYKKMVDFWYDYRKDSAYVILFFLGIAIAFLPLPFVANVLGGFVIGYSIGKLYLSLVHNSYRDHSQNEQQMNNESQNSDTNEDVESVIKELHSQRKNNAQPVHEEIVYVSNNEFSKVFNKKEK